VYPNPSNPVSTVTFSLASPSQTRIDVFTVDGRWVRTLVDRAYPSGVFQVRWDGTGRNGGLAASGAYVLRLQSNSAVDTRKLVLVK
jgi:flagellar hook assembly protein FlgD